jgi:phenylalanine-4-hydroxylase
MFEEAQLYSAVTREDDGSVQVHLGADHPGFGDPAYQARRNAIAAQALDWAPGAPVPRVAYTDEEHEVWRLVCAELAVKHERYACRAYREAAEALALPTDRVPQLDEVSAALRPLTGFTYLPAAGIVPLQEFYGALGDRHFHSTQYIRHPRAPLYTPEPDLIHEVIGHGNLLAHPDFAELNRLAGRAAQRVETGAALQFLADAFWFTIEFGVLWEHGELRAYGAGILSSYGEVEEFRHMEIRPFDLHEMGTLPYDITSYQPVLFAAPSMGALVDDLGSFFAGFDDDTPGRLAAAYRTRSVASDVSRATIEPPRSRASSR